MKKQPHWVRPNIGRILLDGGSSLHGLGVYWLSNPKDTGACLFSGLRIRPAAVFSLDKTVLSRQQGSHGRFLGHVGRPFSGRGLTRGWPRSEDGGAGQWRFAVDTIRMVCACGARLSAPVANLGKKARCPRCASVLTILPDPVDELPTLSELPPPLPYARPVAFSTPSFSAHQYLPPRPRRVQTIQQTAKVWKFGQLVGILAIIGAVAVGLVAANGGTGPRPIVDPAAIGVCFLVGIGGLMVYGVSRFLAWWYHG